jgi:hypothetical protein
MPDNTLNIRTATHGGSVADSGALWTCSCGKRTRTDASWRLPLGWVKMTIFKGEPNGITSINDTIRCDTCSVFGAPKKPLALSPDTQAGLAELLRLTAR